MIGRVSRLFMPALLGLTLSGSIVLAQGMDDQRKALATARAQADAAQARAEKLESAASAAQTEAEQAEAKVSALAARIQATEARITAGEERITLIGQLREEQKQRLAKRQGPVVRLLAALQVMAHRPMMLSFVQPTTTAEVVHVRAILDVLIPEIQKRTASLKIEIAKAQELRGQAEKALKVLEADKAELSDQRKEMAIELVRKRETHRKLASGAMQEQDRAIAMGERARDIVDLMQQLSVTAAVQNHLALLPGPVLRPDDEDDYDDVPESILPGRGRFSSYRLPVAGKLVSGLGEMSDGGVRERGLTISTRPGAQAIAPAAGNIIYASAYRGYGQIIIIDHGDGWTTLVTGLSRLDVVAGDSVSEGSPIGQVGTDNPQVKVELRQNGQPVDITSLIG